MPSFRVVLDTNVLVSAAHGPRSAPGFVVERSVRGVDEPYVASPVMDEYRTVLLRDKFDYIPFPRIVGLLSFFEAHAKWIEPSASISAIERDPSDNCFLECAVSASADFLVTGNTKHFPMGEFQGVRIVTVREFLDRCGGPTDR